MLPRCKGYILQSRRKQFCLFRQGPGYILTWFEMMLMWFVFWNWNQGYICMNVFRIIILYICRIKICYLEVPTKIVCRVESQDPLKFVKTREKSEKSRFGARCCVWICQNGSNSDCFWTCIDDSRYSQEVLAETALKVWGKCCQEITFLLLIKTSVYACKVVHVKPCQKFNGSA